MTEWPDNSSEYFVDETPPEEPEVDPTPPPDNTYLTEGEGFEANVKAARKAWFKAWRKGEPGPAEAVQAAFPLWPADYVQAVVDAL